MPLSSSQQESAHQSHSFHLSSHQLLPGPQRSPPCWFRLWLPPHGYQRRFFKTRMSFLRSAFFCGSPRCSEPRWCPHRKSAQSPDLTLPHLSSSFPTDPRSSSWLSHHRLPALLVCKIITSASSRRRFFLTLKPSQVSVHVFSTHFMPERRDNNYHTSGKVQNNVMFTFSGMDLSK